MTQKVYWAWYNKKTHIAHAWVRGLSLCGRFAFIKERSTLHIDRRCKNCKRALES